MRDGVAAEHGAPGERERLRPRLRQARELRLLAVLRSDGHLRLEVGGGTLQVRIEPGASFREHEGDVRAGERGGRVAEGADVEPLRPASRA